MTTRIEYRVSVWMQGQFFSQIRGRIVRKTKHTSTSDASCHAPLRLMNIINGIRSRGHPCTFEVLPRSVKWTTCSMPGSVSVAASRKWFSGSKGTCHHALASLSCPRTAEVTTLPSTKPKQSTCAGHRCGFCDRCLVPHDGHWQGRSTVR